uniref:DUF3172 domain-containing protein n=1 Tax=Cyanothece sp. (strain PCC 7425 / ATCC 29141) TaxID=395961 RepID=B8HRY8_CYAP4
MPRRPSPPRTPSPRSSPPRSDNRSSGGSPLLNSLTLAVLGGVLVLGIAIGVAFSRTANFTPENVASTQFIDQSAPNPEFCIQFGASAITMDTRVFVTFNPFNIFVSQPVMQPGCVLRINNISILEQRKLVNSQQLQECRQRMNTFGFTGSLDGNPQVNCIYQSNSDKNRFLNLPGVGGQPAETNNF